jgi:hypothetical protein
VFDPESGTIVTTMKLRNTLEPQYVGPDEWVCIYCKKTLQEMIDAGGVSGDAVMVSFDEGMKLYDETMRKVYCKGPQEISKERWWELLEVLPPERWERVGNVEIFMMPECIASTIYTFGVRIGERYFSINECRLKTSSEILKEFQSVI